MATIVHTPLLINNSLPCSLARGRAAYPQATTARASTSSTFGYWGTRVSFHKQVAQGTRSSSTTAKCQRSLQQRVVKASASVNTAIDDPLLLPESPFKGMKALVAGASGGVGQKMVEKLLAVGVPVVALVRDKSKADGVLLQDGVTLVEGDVYQYQTLPKAMKDCNVVLCATGSRSALDPLGPFNVDYQGTKNLVVAANRAEIKHFVFVTSIGTDDILFPLNLFWGVLFWKKRAEEELQRSGMKYTIVRPGGLLNEPKEGKKVGEIVMKGANAYGLPPKSKPGSILREQVADVCVNALVEPSAANKIVEIVAEERASELSFAQLFAGLE